MSSNLFISQLPLPCDARALFSTLSSKPWSILLDSGNSGHIDANIDIIVSSPIITLVTNNGETVIEHCQSGSKRMSKDNPFDLIEQQLTQSGLSRESCALAFSGGIVGHFSYDLARRCENLASASVKDIELPEMAVGIYPHALLFDHEKQTVTLVSRSSQKHHQQQIAQAKSLAQQSGASNAGKSGLTSDWRHQISRQQYGDKFDRVQHYLRQGDCYQINLTQRFEADHRGDEYQTYLKIAAQNNTPFSAFIRLPGAAILSVSPERFIQCHQGNIETKPIKGTRPRSNDPIQDAQLAQELRNSEKDQSENLMIVDLLRNDIGRCALAGSVKVPALFEIESFKNVHHLVSTVQAKLPPKTSPITLLKGAFPGGSITGAPKIRAMNIIDELEPHRRSIYCGSIGYISCDGQMDTNITIRTLLCLENTLYCWAGGGIVADSQVDDEYQECFDKVASIMPVLSNTT